MPVEGEDTEASLVHQSRLGFLESVNAPAVREVVLHVLQGFGRRIALGKSSGVDLDEQR